MEQLTDGTQMLELMLRPAFRAKNRIITQVNQSAAKLFLREGLCLDDIVEAGKEEYASFSGGMLSRYTPSNRTSSRAGGMSSS